MLFTESTVAFYGVFVFSLGQSNAVANVEYQVYSFDASLGLLGGYAALIWQLLSVFISWYQDFSYNNALAIRLYTQDKHDRKEEGDPDNVTEAE